MKIEKVDLTRLKNEDHFELHSLFLDLVNETGDENLGIKPQFDIYKPLFTSLDAAYKRVRKSLLTDQIKEIDKARDRVLQSIKLACKSALKHFDPNIQLAAKKLLIVLKNYGDMDKKNLLGETAAIYNMLQDLVGAYAADVTTLGIGLLVTELRNLNAQCSNLIAERADEEASRNHTIYRDARHEIDRAYHNITDVIDARSLIGESMDYTHFIATWNVHVAKFNLIIKGKRHRTEAGNSQNHDTPD